MAKFLNVSPIPFNRIEETIVDDHVRNCSVGIDCHRDSYHVYFLYLNNDTGKILERYCKFGTLPNDILLVVAFLKDCCRDWDCEIELIILESTGPYSRSLFEALARIWGTCMINPAEFSKYGKKTDKMDARKMALLALQGLFSASFLSSELEEQIKMASRSAMRCRRGVTRESNSLSSFLIQMGVGITRSEARISLLSVSGREILEAIIAGETDPQRAAAAAKYYDPERIRDRNERAVKRLKKHAALVDALQKVRDLRGESREVLRYKLENLRRYERSYEGCLNILWTMLSTYEAEGLNGAQAVDLLATIPSIGTKAAMFILAETGLRIRERYGRQGRFSCDQYISYSGLNPARQYSGDKQTSVRKAVPGNTHLRSMLIECGQSLMKSSHPLGDRCRAIERRNGGARSSVARNIAVCAAAKHLAKAVFWVLLKRERFDDSQFDYSANLRSKEKKLQKLMQEFGNVTGELEQENSSLARMVMQKAAASLTGTPFIVKNTGSFFSNLDGMFRGGTLGALQSVGCRTVSDVWALLSVGELDRQKGIGPKRYAEIVGTLEEMGIISRVGKDNEQR